MSRSMYCTKRAVHKIPQSEIIIFFSVIAHQFLIPQSKVESYQLCYMQPFWLIFKNYEGPAVSHSLPCILRAVNKLS